MNRLAKAIRSHREIARSRREFDEMLRVSSPAMRDELLVIAQRQTYGER